MLQKINRYVNYALIEALLFAIMGLVAIFYPKTSLTILSYILASVLVINGTLLLIMDFKVKEDLIPIYNFPSGILSTLLGVILLLYPEILKIIIPVTIGIWFITTSIFKIKFALSIRQIEKAPWLVTFIMSILIIICGIVLIANPITSTITIVILSGIMVLVYSITDIVNMMIFKEQVNNIVKYFEKKSH